MRTEFIDEVSMAWVPKHFPAIEWGLVGASVIFLVVSLFCLDRAQKNVAVQTQTFEETASRLSRSGKMMLDLTKTTELQFGSRRATILMINGKGQGLRAEDIAALRLVFSR